jgi:hypothetical protein
LYNTPGLKDAFGRKGRRLVEQKYSLEGMLDSIEALYRRLPAKGK